MSGFVAIISLCLFLPACSFAGTTYLLNQGENPKKNEDVSTYERKPIIVKQLPYNPYIFDENICDGITINEELGLWF